MSRTQCANIVTLPDEIILKVLTLLPLSDIVHCSLTCRRLNKVLDASLWRQRCILDFRSWDDRHQLNSLTSKPLHSVNWRRLYHERLTTNRELLEILDGIIENQHGRLNRVDSAAQHGDDIKDVLELNIATEENAPDVLCRRWYARVIYSQVQRRKAIKIWTSIADGQQTSLVEALLCFDKFVLCENALTLAETNQKFDEIAASIRAQSPNIDVLATREKASLIARYLLDINIVGLNDNHNYYDIRNSLLTNALTHPEHPSLPLISTIIYCAVAQRLGLDAKPCPFPMHIYAIIRPDERHCVNSQQLPHTHNNEQESFYIDPFTDEVTKSRAELIQILSRMGIQSGQAGEVLEAAANISLVTRTARNIIQAISEPRANRQVSEDQVFNPDVALYAALWALLLLARGDSERPSEIVQRRLSLLPHIVNHFEKHSPYDAALVRDQLCLLFDTLSTQGPLRRHIHDIYEGDAIPPEPKSRHSDVNCHVRYRVGQVFEHKRYGYEGAIYGWDSECKMSEEWIRQMHVTGLERGKGQPFYHILASDGSTRYVAEDNIIITTPTNPSRRILEKAGQFFKRWDPSTGTFVSNIKDEYPHD